MITSNQYEHSLTVGNLDICAIRDSKVPELLIALKDAEGDPIEKIVLTSNQVEQLLSHLVDPRTQAVFKAL